MGVAKFSREVNLPEDEAKNLLEKFDRRLPYIKELANEVSRMAQSRGFVRTLSGRKKHFDFWEPTNKKLLAGKFPMRFEGAQMEWYRESLQRAHTHKAFNHLIQGGSGDMIKMAMVKAYQEIDFVPHLTNHDELDGSFGTQAECEKVKKVMESAYNLTVPIYADLKVGKSWEDRPWEDPHGKMVVGRPTVGRPTVG